MKLDPLDILLAKSKKLEAGGLCECCGKRPWPRDYQNHHGVVHRRFLNTRYEADNCAALCGKCHANFHSFPDENVKFFKERLGEERYEELKLIARTYHKMSKDRKEEIKAKLKEKIGGLE